MKSLFDVPASVGAAGASVIKPVALSSGTLVSRDLDLTKKFYEEMLGLDCVRIAPDRLIARHRDADRKCFWTVEVKKVDTIERPQGHTAHRGVFVRTNEEVDAASALLMEKAAEYGLHRVQKPVMNHGSYSFYVIDRDTNWWEIECRPDDRAYGLDVEQGDRYTEGT